MADTKKSPGPEEFILDIPRNREEGERMTCKAFLEVKDRRIDTLLRQCDMLRDALKAWQKYDTEHPDKNPCPDHVMRATYLKQARALSEAAIAACKEDSNGQGSPEKVQSDL